MTNRVYRWLVPTLGAVIGLLIAFAELGGHASPAQAAVVFVIVLAYALGIGLLQSRSETASLLSGIPVDERWNSINLQALSLAAQTTAVVLVVAFIGVSYAGGDALPYAILGAVLAFSYMAGILWYRWRS